MFEIVLEMQFSPEHAGVGELQEFAAEMGWKFIFMSEIAR